MKFRRQSYFKKISDSLPKILEKKLKKANFIEISIIKNWKEIVGNDIAKLCFPTKIIFSNEGNINGKIIIQVKRGWSLEIEYKSNEIIDKLNQYFGYKAISKMNIIQNYQTNTLEKKISHKIIKKKISKKIHSKEIKKIKKTQLQRALFKLDKTLFESE